MHTEREILDELTYETFSDRLKETFSVQGDFGSLEMTLVECKKLGDQEGDRRAPFSIIFRGPAEPELQQQIYNLVNEKMGSMDIFLVPIARGDAGMSYEAVFT